jgi:hypothetical protein
MYRSRTPTSSRARSARSTRSARGSTKRRRGAGKGGGVADQIRRAAESGPTRKWVKVMRAPAPRIGFMVAKWIPLKELTEKERQEYERKEMEERKERERQQQLAKQGEERIEEPTVQTDTKGGQSSSTDENIDQTPIPPGKESSGLDEARPTPEDKNEAHASSRDSLEEPPAKKINVGGISTDAATNRVGTNQESGISAENAAPKDC